MALGEPLEAVHHTLVCAHDHLEIIMLRKHTDESQKSVRSGDPYVTQLKRQTVEVDARSCSHYQVLFWSCNHDKHKAG